MLPSVPLALGSNTKTAVGVTEGNGQADLGTTLAQRRDCKTTRQQLICDFQEATMNRVEDSINDLSFEKDPVDNIVTGLLKNLPATAGNRRRELSVARDIRVLVQDVLGGNADVVKEQLAIVDTVAAKFDTHVLDAHTLGRRHIFLADTH